MERGTYSKERKDFVARLTETDDVTDVAGIGRRAVCTRGVD
jgi:hypothetical protein